MPRLLWQLLGAAAAIHTPEHRPASYYFKLGNTLDAYLQYSHEITYSGGTRKKCIAENQIQAAFHDDRSVRENQCFLKCKDQDASIPGCNGYNAHCGKTSCRNIRSCPECYSGSNVICVTNERLDMEALCNSIKECDGYHVKQYGSGKDRFFGGELNLPGCRDSRNGQTSSSGGKLYFRDQVNQPEQCPLGVGVEVSAGPAKYAAMRGLYEAVMRSGERNDEWEGRPTYYEWPQYYVHTAMGNYNYISWHHSGCGWVGLQFDDQHLSTTTQPTCADDDLLANYMFEQCNDLATCATSDPDYEADLCSLITTVWGGNYCTNNIFAMICPVSCSANCLEDNEEAAQQYGLYMGFFAANVNGPYCEKLIEDGNGCSDAVVAKVCPVSVASCPAERRLSVDAVSLRGLRTALTVKRREQRRLGWERSDRWTGDGSGRFEEVFYTWDGFVSDARCSPSVALDYKLQQDEVYDVREYHSPVPGVEWSHACESKDHYVIIDNSANKYCQYNNIPINYNTNQDVVDHGCFRKCSRKPAGEMFAHVDGSWCNGHSENFTGDTNVLCLPREECEDLCTQLGALCHSIDMHATLPRCYLNTDVCDREETPARGVTDHPWIASDDWNILIKRRTPSAEVSPLDDEGRIVFTTDSTADCSDAPGGTTTTGNRKGCEKLCKDDDDCNYFYTKDGQCTMFATLDVGMCQEGLGGELVTKVQPMPCRVTTTDNGVSQHYTRCDAGRFTNPHDGSSFCSDQLVYLDNTNRTRIKYYRSSGRGATVECDGWKLQSNVAPTHTRMLKNCTDKVEAAKIWLPDYIVKRNKDLWQQDFEENYPEPPCIDNVDVPGMAEYYLGITRAQFYEQVGPGGCRALIYNFTDLNISNTRDLSRRGGGLTSFTWTDVLTNNVTTNATTGAWELQYQYNKYVGVQHLLDTWMIRNGTTLCDICCGTYYKDHTIYNQAMGIVGQTCPLENRERSSSSYWNGDRWQNSTMNETHFFWYRDHHRMPDYDAWERMYDFPCQWGKDEGICENPTFAGLCPHTCQPLTMHPIGNRMYSEQSLILYGSKAEYNSTCEADWDNNWAMQEFRVANLTYTTLRAEWPTWDDSSKDACETSISQDVNLCFGHPAAPIVLALCPNACRKARLPDPPPPTEPSDENAPHNRGTDYRRLQQLSEHHYTTTWSGGFDTWTTTTTLVFQPYDNSDDHWVDIYTTWMNGSSLPNSPSAGAYWRADGSFVQGTDTCGSRGVDSNDVNRYGALTTTSLFNKNMKTIPMTLTPVCRGVSICPSLTTCVLTEQRMQDEMSIWRSAVRAGTFISELDAPERDMVLHHGNFVPKTLISADRAEALIDATKSEFAHSIYRSVAMATRVTPTAESDFGDKVIISMVSAAANDQTVASQELGRSYQQISDFMEPWRTDIIRIERFNGDGTAKTEGVFQFKVYAPEMRSDHLVVYRYSNVALMSPVDITTEGGSVVKLEEDSAWMITVLDVNADFIGTEDVDECMGENFPCERGDGSDYTVDGVCTNVFNAAPVCSCPEGYSGNGYISSGPRRTPGAVPCTIKSLTYDPSESHDYYLSMRHQDRLDYGWRINEIKLYSKADCTGTLRHAQIRATFPEPDVPDDTWTYVTSVDHVYTGEYPKANYPYKTDDVTKPNIGMKYKNGMLFDESASRNPNKPWWSSCLNCNPEEVDDTRNGPVEILILIDGQSAVNCIEFMQVEGHHSTSVVIERGPVSGPGCGMGKGQTRCTPTMRWSKENLGLEAPDNQLVTGCGLDDTYFYGELLVTEGTTQSGHFGSIGVKTSPRAASGQVPSPCHCQALCIQYLDQGCRSYKYDATQSSGAGHCYLQTNLFYQELAVPPPGARAGTFPDWTSGTPQLRDGTFAADGSRLLADAAYLQGFEFDAPPADGQPFDLTVKGVGLPYDEDEAKDTSDFQRVKIVESDQGCHEEIPKEVVGIGCARSTRLIPTRGGSRDQTVHTICSPRPDRASAERVTWSGLTITAADEKKTYSVCYCPGDCFLPSSWEKIIGTFEIKEATFTWSSTETSVYRKVGGGMGTLGLTVNRPVFGSYSNAEEWELKLVNKHFDCSVVMDGAKFQCGTGGATDFDTTAPTLVTVFDAGGATEYAEDARYALTFSEPIGSVCGNATHPGAAEFVFTPTGGGPVTIPCDSTTQLVLLEDTVLLEPGTLGIGAGSLAWTEGAVQDRNGNPVAAGSVSFTVVAAGGLDAALYEILGGKEEGGIVSVYFARGTTSGAAITTAVEVNDCGADAVCGSDDDFDEDLANVTMFPGDDGFTVEGIQWLQGRRYQVIAPRAGETSMNMSFFLEFSFGCPHPGVVPTPDSATWSYNLNIAVNEVGKYRVCFREEPGVDFKSIPSTAGAKFVEILRIPADSTHPRGVFHNQFFSALSGANFFSSFTVAGTRLSVPSDSKVLLSAGSCTDPSTFAFSGTVEGPASTDTAAPQMVVSDNLPADGATVGDVRVVKLAFDKALQGCTEEANSTGTYITIENTGTNAQLNYVCAEVITQDQFAFVNVGDLADATYKVVVDTGALRDLNGNLVTKIDTATGAFAYTFTVAQATATTPAVIYSFPAEKAAFDAAAMNMTFQFDFDVTAAADGFVNLYDCGADYACDASTDQLVHRWAAGDLTITDATLTVPSTVLEGSYRRHRVEIPAGTFTASLAYDIEFVQDSTGFDYSFAMHPSRTDSTAAGLVYDMKMTADPGTYNLCYCDDQEDDTLEDRGDGETMYRLSEDKLYAYADMLQKAAVDGVRVEGLTTQAMNLSGHECSTKCSMGCTGPTCYCDGYVGDARTNDVYFCLPPKLCQEACDAIGTSCVGINVHDQAPQCLFVTTEGSSTVQEDWQFYKKESGTPCSQVHDFDQTAGKFAVTQRVDVDVDYVVTPGVDVSIELTTSSADESLTFSRSKYLLSEDRITIIDSLGTCGLSSPSTSVTSPPDASRIGTWTKLAPWSYFQDLPHEDSQNPQDPLRVVKRARSGPRSEYNTREGVYCPEHNMDLDGLEVPLTGVMVPVKSHQCYTKCAVNAPCVGDKCFCGGYFNGYDTETSNAICGDEAFCQYLCDNIEGCKSIDMHNDGERCFLNSDSCDLHSDQLADGSYSLMIKVVDPNDEQASAGGGGGGGRRPRRLAHEVGHRNIRDDFSWDELLRFKPIRIATGGTFTVCFCDSSLLAAGSVCSTEKDFSIKVGTIHASGVSCLISNPKLQRVSCADQEYGGLRCYGHMDAPQPQPPAIVEDEVAIEGGADADDLTTRCLESPEEEVCQDRR